MIILLNETKGYTLSKFGGEFWDERYSKEEYVYGIKPNIYFKSQLDILKPGKILMLGEGEGRNAVYAAVKRWEVDAVDFSEIGKEKALKLANENSVTLNYNVTDLMEYKFKSDYYDAVGNIFLHLHPSVRSIVHPGILNALKKGGYLILEVFEKDQLLRTSGGPQNFEMLYSLEDLKSDFNKMKIHLLEKKIVKLEDGDHHKGEAVVLRLVAQKL